MFLIAEVLVGETVSAGARINSWIVPLNSVLYENQVSIRLNVFYLVQASLRSFKRDAYRRHVLICANNLSVCVDTLFFMPLRK